MIRCTLPWTELYFTVLGGEVWVCCWSKVSLGKQADFPTLESVWNGKEIRRFRRLMLQGKLDGTCPISCSRLLDGTTSFEKFQVTQPSPNTSRATIQEVMEKGSDVVPVPPLVIHVPIEDKCSLRCTMCLRNTGKMQVHPNFYNILSQASDRLEVLEITGGEPFFSKQTLDLLKQASVHPPRHKFAFFSSLSHLPVPLLRSLRIAWMYVSIDGAKKKTYEAIRRGACWENLMKNLGKLFEIRQSAMEPFRIFIHYTVMSKNFQEIPMAVQLFNKMKVPVVFDIVSVPLGHPENFLEHPEFYAPTIKAAELGLREAYFEETKFSLLRVLKISEAAEENRLLATAARLFDEKKLKDAERNAAKIISKNPGCAQAHALLGHIYNAQSKPKQAIVEFENALHLNSEADDARCGLGFSYLKLREYEKAEEEYRMAVDAKPTFAAYHGLAGALRAQDMTEDAAQAYQMAIACLNREHCQE